MLVLVLFCSLERERERERERKIRGPHSNQTQENQRRAVPPTRDEFAR